MREASLLLFFRMVSLLHGRTKPQVERLRGMPPSTFNRYLSIARRVGLVVRCDTRTHAYEVLDPGPFNVERITRQPLHLPGGARRQPRPAPEVRA